eukprot:IDg12686t1
MHGAVEVHALSPLQPAFRKWVCYTRFCGQQFEYALIDGENGPLERRWCNCSCYLLVTSRIRYQPLYEEMGYATACCNLLEPHLLRLKWEPVVALLSGENSHKYRFHFGAHCMGPVARTVMTLLAREGSRIAQYQTTSQLFAQSCCIIWSQPPFAKTDVLSIANSTVSHGGAMRPRNIAGTGAALCHPPQIEVSLTEWYDKKPCALQKDNKIGAPQLICNRRQRKQLAVVQQPSRILVASHRVLTLLHRPAAAQAKLRADAVSALNLCPRLPQLHQERSSSPGVLHDNK